MVKKLTSVLLCISILLSCAVTGAFSAGAKSSKAKSVKLNKTKVVLAAGKKVKLKLKKAKASKVKWKVKNKKIAKIKKEVVTAKKAGTTTVTAKYDKKKFKCSVRVYSKKKLGTKTVTYSKNTVTVSKVKTSFDPSMLDKNAKFTLKKASGLPKLNGVKMKTYDFSISGAKVSSKNVAVLEIPQKVKSGEIPVAGYYNEKTKKWTPVLCSYKDGKISIVTNHFSLYGVGSVKKEKNWFLYNENTTREKVMSYWVPSGANITGEEALDILSKSLKSGSIPSKCADWGWQTVNNLFDNNVNWKANIFGALGINSAVTDFINDYTAEFGVIGFALAYVDAIKYAYNGNNQMAAYKAFNGYSGMVSAYLASKIGTAAMSAGCFAITVVTSIITKAYEDTLSSNERKWYKYYKYYYTHENPRKTRQWKDILLPILESKKSIVKIQNDIDAEVEKYVQEAWNSEWFAGYFYDATGQAFGVGGGLSKAIMNKLSAEYKHELMEGEIALVYEWYVRKLQTDAQNAMQEQTEKLAEEFNKEFTIKFYDGSRKKGKKSSLAGYTVRWKNISKNLKDKNSLKLKLNSKGEASTEYTLFAAINYSIKPEVELVNKSGKVKKTIKYEIKSATTKIDLKPKAKSSGTGWHLTSTDTYTLGYFSSENPDKNAAKVGNSYTSGGSSYKYSFGKNSVTTSLSLTDYWGDKQSCTHTLSLSQPPSTLSKGQKFTLTQTVKLVSKSKEYDALSGPSLRTRITEVNPTYTVNPQFPWGSGHVGSYMYAMNVDPSLSGNKAGTTKSEKTTFQAPDAHYNYDALQSGDVFYLTLCSKSSKCCSYIVYKYTYK